MHKAHVMTVISVVCKSDSHLHLAPEEKGSGASVFTLCLEKWTKREPCRQASAFCPQCLVKLLRHREQREF